jgi:hypothetical protein
MLESSDTPMDTMRPVMPASVSAKPLVSPRYAMTTHSNIADSTRLARATAPSSR